ncbi:MAG: hypothetical protein ACE15E_05240 [Acidobacteriota bacterium]
MLATNGTGLYWAQRLTSSEYGGWRYTARYEFELENRLDHYPPQQQPPCDTDPWVYIYKVKIHFPDGSTNL